MRYLQYFFIFLFLLIPINSTINSTVSGGFNITLENYNSSSYTSRPVSFSNILFSSPNTSDINSKYVIQNVEHDSNLYQTKISIYSTQGNLNSKLCESSFESLNFQNCQINYTDSMITDTKTYYAYVCSEYGDCSLSYPFTFMLKDTTEAITGGMKFTLQSFFNITTNYPIAYISPTLENNAKKYNVNNITIKIYDGNYNLDSCKININGQNYSMTYDNTNCIYTYSFNLTNSTQDISFQAYYTINSIEDYLELRTVTIYPVKNSNNKMPAYGIFSLVISILIIIFGGFIFN